MIMYPLFVTLGASLEEFAGDVRAILDAKLKNVHQILMIQISSILTPIFKI